MQMPYGDSPLERPAKNILAYYTLSLTTCAHLELPGPDEKATFFEGRLSTSGGRQCVY